MEFGFNSGIVLHTHVTFLACSHPFLASHNKISLAKLYNTWDSKAKQAMQLNHLRWTTEFQCRPSSILYLT